MASFHHRIKSGKKGSAAEHSAYIARIGRYEKRRDDLIAAGHGNMPSWANDPITFWRASDKFERKNGAAYREQEIALPEELTPQQHMELVTEMIPILIGKKPYQFAIHTNSSSLESIKNPHIHLMYSDRIQDDIYRPPENTFRRFNAKNPEQGGCRKGSGGKNRMELRDEVISMRRQSAEMQNAALEKHGHAARVDHRTLTEQGIKRSPEEHLGAVKIKGMTDAEKAVYVSKRRGKK